MLRISVMNEPGVTRVKMEGKLAHEWVDEARKAWITLLEISSNTEIVVDLLDVCFVDDAGHDLLSEMRRGGAELIGSGPLMSALINEIKEAEASTFNASDSN